VANLWELLNKTMFWSSELCDDSFYANGIEIGHLVALLDDRLSSWKSCTHAFCANLIKIGGVVAFLDSLPDHMVSASIDCMYGHSFISMTKVTKDRFSLWESCIHAF